MNTTTQPQGELLPRAFAAYYRAGETDTPSNNSNVVKHDGKEYVVLRNRRGVLAVYRVRTSGVLKRLDRWPSQLEKW